MNNQIDRDSQPQYRIAALQCAIDRAGQDGGLEGKIEVFGYAEVYLDWFNGKTDVKEPELDKG